MKLKGSAFAGKIITLMLIQKLAIIWHPAHQTHVQDLLTMLPNVFVIKTIIGI